jgi:RNA polymerase sigma-70 factor (ECF subfamily)
VKNNIKPDSTLIKETLRGRLDSFEIIVKRYQTMINSYTYRILKDADVSDDATQETFIKFYENIRKFDIGRPLKPWLYKIAKNTSYDLIRKNKKVVKLEWDVASDKEAEIEKVIRDENRHSVRKAVKKLPNKYKIPIMGYYFKDMDYKTLAKELRLPINTLRTRLRRAKIELAKLLTK